MTIAIHRPARGSMFLLRTARRTIPTPPARPAPELIHGGDDDLLVWPPSAPELALAGAWLDSGDPSVRDELYVVAQSTDRAAAICEKAYIDRRAVAADELLARAFGVPASVDGAR